jgi:hypothetical protein
MRLQKSAVSVVMVCFNLPKFDVKSGGQNCKGSVVKYLSLQAENTENLLFVAGVAP